MNDVTSPPTDSVALARTASQQELADACQKVLSHHARSFRWAQVFLPKKTARDAAVLYAFCRAADDAVDEAESAIVGKAQLQWLRDQFEAEAPTSPMVALLHDVIEKRSLVRAGVDDLLDGVEQDVSEVRMADRGELLRYCYRVAGAVGLLMCGVLGVKDKRALPFAIDLGIAMQLTNISRDVYEDKGRGRLYLPADAIEAKGDKAVHYLEGSCEPRSLRPVVKSLLDLAERYYQSAERGMHFIPWRARFAIYIAARLYRGIGVRIAQAGYGVWQRRHYVGALGKVVLVATSGLRFVVDLFKRKPTLHESALHHELVGLKSWPLNDIGDRAEPAQNA